MPESEHHRLARLEDTPMAAGTVVDMPPELPMFKSGPMSLFPTAKLGNRTDILSADIPAGGKTSAGAIARMYAALLGQVDGVRLITSERLREFGIGGAGGSFAFGDTATRIGFAVTKNRLTPDFSAATQLSQIVTKAISRG
jgi:hypothetical protein